MDGGRVGEDDAGEPERLDHVREISAAGARAGSSATPSNAPCDSVEEICARLLYAPTYTALPILDPFPDLAGRQSEAWVLATAAGGRGAPRGARGHRQCLRRTDSPVPGRLRVTSRGLGEGAGGAPWAGPRA